MGKVTYWGLLVSSLGEQQGERGWESDREEEGGKARGQEEEAEEGSRKGNRGEGGEREGVTELREREREFAESHSRNGPKAILE